MPWTRPKCRTGPWRQLRFVIEARLGPTTHPAGRTPSFAVRKERAHENDSKTIAILLVSAIMVSILAVNVSAEDKTSLVINITSDSPLGALKALELAHEALMAGYGFSVHLSVDGVPLASKYTFFGQGPSLGRMAQKKVYALIRKGAEVTVCPLSVDQFNMKEDELIYGVEFLKPTDMVVKIMDPDVRVVDF